MGLNPHRHLVPRVLEKSRAIPLLTLRAFVAYKNGENLLTILLIWRLLVIYEGKAVPLQAWSGPEDSRKLRSPDFMTTAQDGGKVVSPTHRSPLPPGNAPDTHSC